MKKKIVMSYYFFILFFIFFISSCKFCLHFYDHSISEYAFIIIPSLELYSFFFEKHN